MAGKLDGCRVAIVVANEGVEQIELKSPREALETAGAEVVLIAPETGDIQAFNHLDKGEIFIAEQACAQSDVGDFDALVLPGGVANPDQLRTEESAVSFVHDFVTSGRPVGVICHGPWTLVEADAVRGRTLTSWPSLQTDLTNAGATWVDEPLVVCKEGPGPIISSRNPDDLPDFCNAIISEFAAGSSE